MSSDKHRHSQKPPTTSFNLVPHLKEIDLTHLKVLTIKGGEPFMNPELLPILQYFSEINVLQNLTVKFVTNGTILGKEIEKVNLLLKKAKKVVLTLSVDGVEDVGTYIRYSPQKFAKISNIEAFIQSFNEHKNVCWSLFPSIQVYNIFSLYKVVEWWDSMVIKYKIEHHYIELHHFVLGPTYLSVGALQPDIIKKIIQFYEDLSDKRYNNLISSLKKFPYLGDRVHNEMVKYTSMMDKIKGQNVFESIPELVDEMIIR